MLVLLSACSGRPGGYGTGWDGRRGYDGNGDYGYDLAASRAAAATYRAHAARSYPAPGRPEDPWRPYISEAAARHAVPERWIREVMRQESGGRLFAADGSLITSRAGAMGLMQVMPRTYDTLRRRHGLGDDPYEPRDNILAGAAYIREMYDRFGAPHFLAAYNAGPERVEAYRKRGVEARLPAGWVDVLVRRGAWSFGPTLWSTLTMTRRTAAIGV
ncbi:transglycosylase SLT domain-containing protein [Siccirubricoccus sp. G192]|nr:transglycosylase SLT domain-containing protein [Siccirubricoccus sp. G192]